MRNVYLIFYLLSNIANQDAATNDTQTIIDKNATQATIDNTIQAEEFNLTYYEELHKKYYENLDKVEEVPKTQEELDEEMKEAQEWENRMQNYFPENILTVTVEPGQNEFFYIDIDLLPNKIVLAFYVHDEEEKIDFEASYNKVVIHKAKNKGKYFYEFNPEKEGTYTFVLRNDRVNYF
jgi:hypothetical protein